MDLLDRIELSAALFQPELGIPTYHMTSERFLAQPFTAGEDCESWLWKAMQVGPAELLNFSLLENHVLGKIDFLQLQACTVHRV